MEVSSRRSQLAETEGRIDQFRFAREEIRISKEMAEDLEGDVSELNDRIANLDYDIGQIRSSMQRSLIFDLKHIQKVFEETQTFFAPQLVRDYEQLVQFNKTITSERAKFLKEQLQELERERTELIARKAEIDETRARFTRSCRSATPSRNSNRCSENRQLSVRSLKGACCKSASSKNCRSLSRTIGPRSWNEMG